jgi:hypothetical protein
MHRVQGQIEAFIDRDKGRKALFSLDYFEKKCASISYRIFFGGLPKRRTREAFLATFLVYRYWTTMLNCSGDWREPKSRSKKNSETTLLQSKLKRSKSQPSIQKRKANFQDKGPAYFKAYIS